MAARGTITFLSDYGHADDFVGVCHGVMARIAPDARILDVSHGVPRHDVRSGAIILRRALPYFPAGVHLAVVDPEVGGERGAIAVRTADEDRILVGPDNGLLSLAARRFGGAVEAVDLTRSSYRLEPTSATFHGRDIFAPVAAHLAAGVHLADAGDPVDPDELVTLDMPLARAEGDELVAHAIAFDRFGNVVLDVEHEELAAFGLRLGHPMRVNASEAVYATTFADVPEGRLLVYEDAYRTLALAVNRGSAAERLDLVLDAEVRIGPA
ncbi:MAG TPA: SAM-dependent chlorinase/fluorinase [Solirubrobacteraceae bacterium]|nr:SAM-dependent chlorinase/fluorinase [Solirubrobacteraceae bacterium]